MTGTNHETMGCAEVARMVEVTKFYEGSGTEEVALKRVSFRACPGELVLVLGPSGSGKTTFLTLLAGLQQPSSGQVWLFGKEVEDYSREELQRLRSRRIGMIFQSFHLIDALTGLENVMLVQKFAGVPTDVARQSALDHLERFEVGHRWNAYPPTMSQGERQRVSVARALVNRAELIIADEPTGSLATKQGMMIVRLLKEGVKQDRLCVIIASHDERIAHYADRVFRLRDGVLESQTPC